MPTDILMRGRGGADQYVGGGSAWVQQMPVYAARVDSQTAGDITTIYKGWAEWGTADGAAGWRITKTVLDETGGNLALTEGIANNGDFISRWTDRDTLTYL